MKTKFEFLILLNILMCSGYLKTLAQTVNANNPIINETIIFEETHGLIAVEAEYFYKQTKTDVRQWYRVSRNETPNVGRDDDNTHCIGASNNAYLEILPDTRVTHSDKLIRSENFSEQPGEIGVISYKVNIDTPGRYYVWVRAFSTGGEDNGIHVGLDGEWPESGQRMQWCDGKGHWTWASKQRTKEVHCGIPHAIFLDIENAGIHTIEFSMREDGFEFDKFILTQDIHYVPVEKGPKTIVVEGLLPPPFPECDTPKPQKSYFNKISSSLPENIFIHAQEFAVDGTNFYKNGKNWLAINPKEFKEASTSTVFNFNSGKYDIVFVGVGENDGNSTFKVFINDKEIGSYATPKTDKLFEEGKRFSALWPEITVKKGDKITVHANVGTDGHEWTRARWAGIIFAPVGKGNDIQDAPSTYTAN
ncbi:hypothetical protein [Litoribaculum gwangyangense]|uniref:Gylcosyl hydrolase 115 C-terminal domain-containing protein n=1 Tax=Litoribaculum gwangyangense TaxID=1130722 RepID=A0ABP9CN99_9FLAO